MFRNRIWKIILVLISAITLLQGCNEAGEREVAYSRSDCIARVDFNWPKNIPYDEKVEIKHQIRIPDFLRGVVAGYTLPRHENGASIYIQYYPKGCDQKYGLSGKFMNELRSKIDGFPDFTVSKDVIEPSTRTIDLTGSSWK
ncbi:MAG: hypothetical protein RNU03_12475 [Candidatus Sedimenticola sp. (ex Thyasira tokunagai)]